MQCEVLCLSYDRLQQPAGDGILLGLPDSAAQWLLLPQSVLVNTLWTNIKEQLWSLGATQTQKM